MLNFLAVMSMARCHSEAKRIPKIISRSTVPQVSAPDSLIRDGVVTPSSSDSLPWFLMQSIRVESRSLAVTLDGTAC